MNQTLTEAKPIASEVHYRPGGPMHDLLRDHVTNMTTQQQKVCASVVQEWQSLQLRNAFLEGEVEALLKDVARLTRENGELRGRVAPLAHVQWPEAVAGWVDGGGNGKSTNGKAKPKRARKR